MHECLVNSIPFRVTDAEVIRRMESNGQPDTDRSTVSRMVEQAREVARPLAFYRIGCIEGRGEDWVDIHGVRLESRGLRERTSHVNPLSVSRLASISAYRRSSSTINIS